MRKREKNRIFDEISRNHENIELCYYCNSKIENYLNKCAYCGKKFCDAHRLSDNHECLAQIVTDVKEYLIAQYQKLDSIGGEPSEAFVRRAGILSAIKRPGATIKLCEYIMENHPDVHEAIYLAATQYEKLRDFKQALNLYKQALEITSENKDYGRSYNLLASKIVLDTKKRFRTAKQAFDTLEDKDEEVILKQLSYNELLLKIEELYTPPELRKMISGLKSKAEQNKLPREEQVELIQEKFTIEQLESEPNRYTVDFGNGYNILLDLTEYPKPPSFEFPYFVEDNFDAESLYQKLHSLRTWSELQPYSIAEVLTELKACLGFYGFGKIQLSQQFVDMVKQTAKEHAPSEMGGFIQLDRWIIWRLRLPEKYFSTPFATGFYSEDFPFNDTSVVGFVHSHTLGPAHPSDQDRQTFQLYYINMILGSSKAESSLDQLIVFDRLGKEKPYEIVQLLDDDMFPLEEEKKDSKTDLYL